MHQVIRTALRAWFALALIVMVLMPARAQPDSAESTYRQECGACHLAFPGGFLPAASWQRLLSGLDQHFGTNATLDPLPRKRVGSWLESQAGSYRRVRNEPRQDRITLSDWFVRKHDEITPSTWRRTSIGSPANCAACHVRAEQGDFNEHRVRIPQ